MNNFRILVVDDDPVTRLLLKKALTRADYEVELAEDGLQALELISAFDFEVVITDLIMPGDLTGIDVLTEVKAKGKDTEVFLLTGYASVDTAVTAMKKGAADYLQKPVNIDEMLLRLGRIRELRALLKDAGDLREAMDVTEKTAGNTIQRLELMVVDLDNKLKRVKDILAREDHDVSQRVSMALRILT
jgi:two-component system, OmpR family, response regulator